MVDVDEAVNVAIGTFVILILVANLLPSAFSAFFDVPFTDPANNSTANWSTDVQTLWRLTPLIAVIVLVMLLVFWTRKSGRF